VKDQITTDFAPLLDQVAATAPDLLFSCSYLSDSIALVRAINAWKYQPKMVGASMIGPQNASVKTALGPLLNGFVNYEYWLPVPKMMFPGVMAFMENTNPRRRRQELTRAAIAWRLRHTHRCKWWSKL